MTRTHRYQAWIRLLVIVWLVALGWLIHHVAEGHHADDHSECPVCLSAAAMMLPAAASLPALRRLLLGTVAFTCRSCHSRCLFPAQGRSPPPIGRQ